MKILYVATISDTINAFLIPHIKMLIDSGHRVDVACNVQSELKQELTDLGVKVHNIQFSRSPFDMESIKAYQQIKDLVNQEGFEVVHTHTPTASVITRLACRNMKAVKMIYTSHGFSFCKGDAIKNWLIFYPIEKFCAYFTDVIITINQEDYNIAKKFGIKQTYLIPGIGLDIQKFKKEIPNLDKNKKREELMLSQDDIVICSVGELSKRKNQEVIIEAIDLLDNSKIKYIICGEGPEKQNLKELSEKLGLKENVLFLGQRNDIPEILKISDIAAFPSLREGLGLAGIEAMAAGIPLVSSNRHGIKEYAIDEETALTCDPNNASEFKDAINRLINDANLSQKLVSNGYSYIEKFDISKSLQSMKEIYEKELTS